MNHVRFIISPERHVVQETLTFDIDVLVSLFVFFRFPDDLF